ARRFQLNIVGKLDPCHGSVVSIHIVVVAEGEEFTSPGSVRIILIGDTQGGHEPTVATMERTARRSEQSEPQLLFVAAIGVHRLHHSRRTIGDTVPRAYVVDGASTGAPTASGGSLTWCSGKSGKANNQKPRECGR